MKLRRILAEEGLIKTAAKVSVRSFNGLVKRGLSSGATLAPHRKETFSQGTKVFKAFDVLDSAGVLISRYVLSWDKSNPGSGNIKAYSVFDGEVIKGRPLYDHPFTAESMASVVQDLTHDL